MGFVELFLIGVGLSMDAFAVAIGKSLAMKRMNGGQAVVIALFFGGFQALMPVIGWALGAQFALFVGAVDHWVAFALLVFIGGKMIWDALHDEDSPEQVADHADDAELAGCAAAPAGKTELNDADAHGSPSRGGGPADDASTLNLRELFVLAVATSIDALAMGVTFAFLQVNIVQAATIIGVTTFTLSLIGVLIGRQFGSRWEKASTIAGGVVLVLIGCKTLLESLL